MLLLYLLLSEQQDAERRRLLIDTLLYLSKASAVSVCRLAGVQPGNLSAFRRPNGSKHVSAELQERLLAALGWAGGLPSPEATHEWEVRDDKTLLALQWILQDRSMAAAKLSASSKAKQASLDTIWSGHLVPGGAPCTISIGSYLKLPDGTTAQAMMHELIDSQHRSLGHIQKNTNERHKGGVTKEPLRQRVNVDVESGLNTHTFKLFDQRKELGLTDEILESLVEDWVCRQASESPADLLNRLSKIDKLKIGEKEFSPASMSQRNLEDLVKSIALIKKSG